MRRRAVLGLAAVMALATACDSGPKGPGTLAATVLSDQALGAVVLMFTGGTVTGFEGQGSTQVYSSAIPGTEAADPTFRVILVSPDGGMLRFGIRVSDLDAARPVVTAITAATTANLPLEPVPALRIKIEH